MSEVASHTAGASGKPKLYVATPAKGMMASAVPVKATAAGLSFIVLLWSSKPAP